MSLRNYELSKDIEHIYDLGEDFYAFIMAAMRNADTPNLVKLKEAWPDVYEELRERYNAPRGLLVGERDADGWSRTEEGLFDPDDKLVRAV